MLNVVSQERTNFNDEFLTDNLPHFQKFYQNEFSNPKTKIRSLGTSTLLKHCVGHLYLSGMSLGVAPRMDMKTRV